MLSKSILFSLSSCSSAILHILFILNESYSAFSVASSCAVKFMECPNSILPLYLILIVELGLLEQPRVPPLVLIYKPVRFRIQLHTGLHAYLHILRRNWYPGVLPHYEPAFALAIFLLVVVYIVLRLQLEYLHSELP